MNSHTKTEASQALNIGCEVYHIVYDSVGDGIWNNFRTALRTQIHSQCDPKFMKAVLSNTSVPASIDEIRDCVRDLSNEWFYHAKCLF